MTQLQEQICDIYDGLQTKLNNEDACHFLCLCSIAHESTGHPVDVLGTITKVHRRWMESDYFVTNALAILEMLTRHKWTMRKESTLPSIIKDNEYTELLWENPKTGRQHFTRRYVDTVKNSKTVRDGYVKEYRIYTMEV